MLQSAFLPKLTIALALMLWLAAPAAADTQTDLSGRIDRLEHDLAHARSDMQLAQLYNRPPGNIPGSDGDGYSGAGQDAAGLDVRVDRLENQMRTLNGQIEQMQFDLQRLDDQLRKFQQDVDFRFQDSGHGAPVRSPPPAGQRHSESDDQTVPASAASVEQSAAAFGASGRGTKRDDAFDPSADPDAPGAPHVLGTLQADAGRQGDSGGPPIIAAPAAAGAAPLQQAPLGAPPRDPDAPLELSSAPRAVPGQVYAANSPYAANPPPNATAPSVPAVQPQTDGGQVMQGGAAQPGAARTPPPGSQLAALPAASPRDEFDAAAAALKGEQFDTAESEFKAFVDKYPKDKLVPDAVFYLGETYFQRGRYREAAEQYLKISSDFSKTAKAPDSLLRLGQSLDKLGAKEQACAAFAEVGRKYPSASASLRAMADREAKRVQC
jgi:tol-pal system protein YbgF